MKLVTLAGGPDGRLALVDRALERVVEVADIAPTMQTALERWDEVEPALRGRAEALESGKAADIRSYDPTELLAVLPRAWQWLDGSAFTSHGDLMSIAFGIEPLPNDQPLMYQGMSDRFHPSHGEVSFVDEADDIDFEAEFGVIVSAVPRGVSAAEAEKHIRLVVIINDWSLRAFGPAEMKRSFGFVQAKPASSTAPVAVTPDELGEYWRGSRVHLDMEVARNGQPFGHANGGAMSWGFADLVAHAARTRDLVAGTILGSGTVSNDTYRTVGSSCITERRMVEFVDTGSATTEFMRFGDTVTMQAHLPGGGSVFGTLDQTVVHG
ncbi:MAG: fumarylacetoacetate hydrolase [Subtercola sp.]|nr:fumarylacetoacetate hydrolase [Subtercola sp.]